MASRKSASDSWVLALFQTHLSQIVEQYFAVRGLFEQQGKMPRRLLQLTSVLELNPQIESSQDALGIDAKRFPVVCDGFLGLACNGKGHAQVVLAHDVVLSVRQCVCHEFDVVSPTAELVVCQYRGTMSARTRPGRGRSLRGGANGAQGVGRSRRPRRRSLWTGCTCSGRRGLEFRPGRVR